MTDRKITTHAIVGPDKRYMCGLQAFVEDGRVLDTAGQTPEEYLADHPDYEMVPYDTWKADYKRHLRRKKIGPEPITQDQWTYALNVLPPCRWETRGGYSFFHVSERRESCLVDWYARQGDRFWHLVDDDHVSFDHLVARMRTVDRT